ncbi:MAG: hypothetical protein U1E10_19015 [Bdellovibrionales bacterium]|nr:hypothetical protein [Bdellovibrionales bacterium]
MDDQTLSGITVSSVKEPPPPNRRNRMIYAIAALVAVLVIIELLLGFQDGAVKIPFVSEPTGVAKVLTINGDARYQPAEEQSWYKAKVENEMYSGDAIYSGASTDVGVEMKSGGQIALGEETLVIFDSIDGVTIPDLARGNVRLRILGDMKISISGDVSQFSAGAGGESEVLISIDEGSKGKIQVLSGRPKITAPKQTSKFVESGSSIEFVTRKFRLSSRKQIELPKDVAPLPSRVPPGPVPAETVAEQTPPIAEPVYENPAPIDQRTEIVHTLTKAETYSQSKGLRLQKMRNLKFVESAGVLRWTGGNGQKTFLQVTRINDNKAPNFEEAWFNDVATGQDAVLSKWRPGKNLWRVSLDGKNWSKPSEVDVSVRFSVGREPSLVIEDPVVHFPNPVVRMRLTENSGRKMSGWIIEGGRDQTFKKSVSVWAGESKLMVPLKSLGTYFFRVRSVDEQGEISAFSKVHTVSVLKEKVKPVPLRLVKKPQVEKPPREIATQSTMEDVPFEKPAPSSTMTRESVKQESSFVRAGPWAVSLLGGFGAVISGVQTEAGIAPPVLQVLGLGAEYFDGRYEAKVNYRSRIGFSGGIGGAPSIARLDLRGGHWWKLGWRPLKTSLRLGWMVGYENYQNLESRDFSPFYEVAKTGLGVNIDVTERIQTGGTVLFGTWMNSNFVTEVDGFLAYDFLENLNLGIGYRVGLFEAGTITSSPSILPYREATGEAYSQLKFSF